MSINEFKASRGDAEQSGVTGLLGVLKEINVEDHVRIVEVGSFRQQLRAITYICKVNPKRYRYINIGGIVYVHERVPTYPDCILSWTDVMTFNMHNRMVTGDLRDA